MMQSLARVPLEEWLEEGNEDDEEEEEDKEAIEASGWFCWVDNEEILSETLKAAKNSWLHAHTKARG